MATRRRTFEAVQLKKRQRNIDSFVNPQTKEEPKKEHKIETTKIFNNKDTVPKKRDRKPITTEKVQTTKFAKRKVQRKVVVVHRYVPVVQARQLAKQMVEKSKSINFDNIEDNVGPVDLDLDQNQKIKLPLPHNVDIASIPAEFVPDGFTKTRRWDGEWVIVPDSRLRK